jgi:GDP-4-dehydro-6-deoxy-D-mannose reductase
MRAIITGGAGFVGGYLAAHLQAHGDEPIVLDRVHGLDIRDANDVLQHFEHARPDVVYHLAAFTHVGDSWNAATEVLRVNVEGTLNVLDACRALGVQRALIVGSSEEYGKINADEVPIKETTPLRPTTPYGASKAAAGLLAQQAWYGHGFAAVRARPFNHTGAGQPPSFVAPALADRLVRAEREDRDFIPVGNLSPIRELLDVRDVVRAYRLLMEHGEPGEVYNIATGHGHRIGDLANTMVSFASRPIELRPDPEFTRAVEVERLVGDPTRIEQRTGWTPSFSLEETMRSVYDHAAAQSG